MNNNQQQPRPLSAVLESIPFFYKFIGACLLITGIFSLFTNLFPIVFANYPYYALFYVNLWRLFTSLFIADGLFTAAMSMLVLWFVLPVLVSFHLFRKEVYLQLCQQSIYLLTMQLYKSSIHLSGFLFISLVNKLLLK